MQSVLTPTIMLWVFKSPKGLPSPIFGSVSGDLTTPSKWGCDNLPTTHLPTHKPTQQPTYTWPTYLPTYFLFFISYNLPTSYLSYYHLLSNS